MSNSCLFKQRSTIITQFNITVHSDGKKKNVFKKRLQDVKELNMFHVFFVSSCFYAEFYKLCHDPHIGLQL